MPQVSFQRLVQHEQVNLFRVQHLTKDAGEQAESIFFAKDVDEYLSDLDLTEDQMS